MHEGERARRRHPTWVRVALVGLQALGLVGGLLLGMLTYAAWSQPADSDPSSVTTTTVIPPETAVPPDTLLG
jgi:hypothetical protein